MEFDSLALDYDSLLNKGLSLSGESKDFFASERVAWLAKRLNRLSFRPNVVLDYGCGTGTATPFLLNTLKTERVIGVDVSSESLQVAEQAHRGLPAAYYCIGEYEAPGSIDIVYCNGVFHHIPIDDRSQAMEYIARCLRPGGYFAFWENNPWSPAARIVMSRIPFDHDAIMVWPAGAKKLLREVGLQPIAKDYRFIFPNALRKLRPLESAFAQVPLGAQYMILARK